MNKSKKVDEKIDELMKLAEQEKDNSAIVVISALQSSRISGNHLIFARIVQNIIATILMPMQIMKSIKNQQELDRQKREN